MTSRAQIRRSYTTSARPSGARRQVVKTPKRGLTKQQEYDLAKRRNSLAKRQQTMDNNRKKADQRIQRRQQRFDYKTRESDNRTKVEIAKQRAASIHATGLAGAELATSAQATGVVGSMNTIVNGGAQQEQTTTNDPIENIFKDDLNVRP